MNAEILCDAMRYLDSQYIDAAGGRQAARRVSPWVRWGGLAACLCLLAVGGFALWGGGPAPESPAPEGPTPGAVSLPPQSGNSPAAAATPVPEAGTGADVAVILPWGNMTITQQFSYVPFDGREYFSREGALPAEAVGELLGTAELTGWDVYLDREHHTTAQVYAIKGISRECAAALKFDEDDRYYPCVNSYYKPATLGQFIDDLSLEEHLTFGDVGYSFFDDHRNYSYMEFTGTEAERVWALLLSHRSARNAEEYNDPEVGYAFMTVSLNMELLGYRNISLSVTDTGYLTTNLLDTGKAFNIGMDKVNAFTAYVLENWDGQVVFSAPADASGDETAPAGTASPAVLPR